MAERNLDFDTVVERANTNSLKYDFAAERGKPEGILPLWVADMDFRVSSYIQDAVFRQAEHGIWGYSDAKKSYFEAVQSWMLRHHGWKVEPEWMLKTPGVVFALAMAVQAFTEEGDAVMIQTPVYYPFKNVIESNGRRIVDNTLVQEKDGRYHMDIQDFEEKILQEKVKLFLLCNPHNPVGRVWSREELEQIGDICLRHGVVVASDEIHADFVYQGKHQVFADIREEYKDIAVICTSPSKTFNIAGLQVSNIFIPNPELRKRMKLRMDAAGYSQVNGVGLAACEAAYGDGEEWYQAMLDYVKGNIAYTTEFLKTRIPEIKVTEPEGTYLIWMDFRNLQMSEDELEELVVQKAGLWLDKGLMFGEAGKGFQRINVACPRVTLKKALERLEQAVKNR